MRKIIQLAIQGKWKVLASMGFSIHYSSELIKDGFEISLYKTVGKLTEIEKHEFKYRGASQAGKTTIETYIKEKRIKDTTIKLFYSIRRA